MAKNHLSRTVVYCVCLAAPGLLLAPHVQGQHSSSRQSSTTASVVHAPMVSLVGNVRREANAANDRGEVNGNMQMDHMLLQLKRPAEREIALLARIASMHQPGSPDFHHWLTADELGRQFGPDPSDIQTVVTWLETYGFQVNNIAKSGMVIDFSGSVRQVELAFNPGIHNLQVNGKPHVANMRNPQIPAAFANIVVGISSLTDFRPRPANTGISSRHIDPLSKAVVAKSNGQGAAPGFTASAGNQLVVPDDLHTIYNFNPIYKKASPARDKQ